MNKQITVAQYRAIDLTMLCGLLVASLWVINTAVFKLYPDQNYVLSPVAAMVALVMMRWNGYSAIHAVVGGLVFVFLIQRGPMGESVLWQQYLVYGIGNLGGMLGLLMFRFLGKDRICSDALKAILFGVVVQTGMWLGRVLTAVVMGFDFSMCLGYISTDVLSIVFTIVVVWIVRRVNGLFEDQIKYLLRLEGERQVEGRDQL